MNDLVAVPSGTMEFRETSAFEMKPKTLAEAMKFCEIMADSDLVPKDFKAKPGNIMVAIQMGLELGLSPMRSLKSIAVINGRACMWGDELLAMVLASPVCEYVREQESTDKEGVCRVKRKGDAEEHVSRFSLEDAKRAGLLGKQGAWQTSTKRMLQLRARGFALRDKFADVLAGLVSSEEALDLPASVEVVPEEKSKTLKDRLKEQVNWLASDGGNVQAMANTAEHRTTPQQVTDAEPAPIDNPADPWIRKIEQADTAAQVQQIWQQVPEALQQDVYGPYAKAMKALGKKK